MNDLISITDRVEALAACSSSVKIVEMRKIFFREEKIPREWLPTCDCNDGKKNNQKTCPKCSIF